MPKVRKAHNKPYRLSFIRLLLVIIIAFVSIVILITYFFNSKHIPTYSSRANMDVEENIQSSDSIQSSQADATPTPVEFVETKPADQDLYPGVWVKVAVYNGTSDTDCVGWNDFWRSFGNPTDENSQCGPYGAKQQKIPPVDSKLKITVNAEKNNAYFIEINTFPFISTKYYYACKGGIESYFCGWYPLDSLVLTTPPEENQ